MPVRNSQLWNVTDKRGINQNLSALIKISCVNEVGKSEGGNAVSRFIVIRLNDLHIIGQRAKILSKTFKVYIYSISKLYSQKI